MLEVLDAAAVRRWCSAGLDALTAVRDELDDLNVYPVPDGDTGTNLQLTMAAVVDAVTAAPHDMASTVAALITGSLMGARGNSGIILSQLLHGMGEVWGPLEAIGPVELKQALLRGVSSAYAAVADPVEGTVLTVARAAADAASGDHVAAVIGSARVAALAALDRTPDQLPALKAAGVVDAAGQGWCVLLEALELVVTGVAAVVTPALLVPRRRSALAVAREGGSEQFAYEVQFLLRDGNEVRLKRLREQLRALGDSLLIVGSAGLHKVHVHVNDVGAAVEAGVEAGTPFQICVTRFEDQRTAPAAPVSGRCVVAVAAGAGLATLFRESGASVVQGGFSNPPSTAALLTAMRACGVGQVVLLPNDGDVNAVAQAAADRARSEGIVVAVIPTRSVLQGLAAASVADATKAFDHDVSDMAAASGATRWAVITRAVKAADTAAGPCLPGDVLGILGGEVALVGSDLAQVSREVLRRLLDAGGELATVVLGADAEQRLGPHFEEYLSTSYPAVDVVVLDGGQPDYPVLLGVE